MSKPSRVTKVQVPGEVPAPPADEPMIESPADEQPSAAAEVAKQAPAKVEAARPAGRLSRADYANMRAADVDPSTLKTAVLTRDGWVCPPVMGARG